MASEKKVPVKRETEYVVLQKTVEADNEYTWMYETVVKATSSAEALKVASREALVRPDIDPKASGEFVAVPARSWKPMRRNVEQVTKETWTA